MFSQVPTLTDEGGTLKDTVVCGEDFELLPQPIWKAIHHWYVIKAEVVSNEMPLLFCSTQVGLHTCTTFYSGYAFKLLPPNSIFRQNLLNFCSVDFVKCTVVLGYVSVALRAKLC